MSERYGRCKVFSATLRGVEAQKVVVEVMVSNGLPGMTIVGMPDAAVQEARERVRSALKASGFAMPADKVVVNLAPANMKKIGSGFDLPIALGILCATAQMDASIIQGKLAVGELSLDGFVRGIPGTLAFGHCAYKEGLSLITSADSPSVPLSELRHELLDYLGSLHHGGNGLCECKLYGADRHSGGVSTDFADIAGHEMAKRALSIAAAGSHGLLLMGPPGSGKTMLASRLPGILPELSEEELLETAIIHSVAGEDIEPLLCRERPFRKPHHSASKAGLIGGGTPIRPGEISLAHHGVLFLDEIAEFSPAVLQCMRQPIESGSVAITRAEGTIVMPARFMLVAASNPCPCGYYGDKQHACRCSEHDVNKYQSRIGGPLIDRIDMHLNIERLPPESIFETGKGTSSAVLREDVERARSFAVWRKAHEGDLDFTTRITGAESTDPNRESKTRGAPRNRKAKSSSPADLVSSCAMTDEAQDFLASMARDSAMSGRSIIRTLSIARTIADMAEKSRVEFEHIAEALAFRLRDSLGK